MIAPRLALVAGTALATAVALTFASPAFADHAETGAPTASTDELGPVTNPAEAVVGDRLPEDEVAAQLESLAGKQPRREIAHILESNVAAAMMTDPETAEVVAAVVLPIDLRTLTPVAPGCTSNSACLKNTAGTPFAPSASPRTRSTTGGNPVTVTKISR
ncbi:hypothetical protein [Curtobacterium sp. Leaf261]|uniref:hypothetical protein n=1 Tax=Curtobacterium sp. Leaf261 TaxID=1736311 RepID=UPI000A4BDA48|nr:hypothetical protein [Curtobacterium sp. Leaf261]